MEEREGAGVERQRGGGKRSARILHASVPGVQTRQAPVQRPIWLLLRIFEMTQQCEPTPKIHFTAAEKLAKGMGSGINERENSQLHERWRKNKMKSVKKNNLSDKDDHFSPSVLGVPSGTTGSRESRENVTGS